MEEMEKTKYSPEKPSVLYHASADVIEKLEPRNESVRDRNEGAVIFGTPDFAYATMFIVDTDDSWTQKGRFDSVYYTVISDEKRFKNLDMGGYVYELPSDDFSFDPTKSMRDKEYTSRKEIVPTGSIHFSSGLQAMIDNGVQVYFVDSDTFGQIKDLEDHGLQILKAMQSENQKRGKNIIELPG